MANAESYARWLVENESKKGTQEFDTVAQAYKAAREQAGAVAPKRDAAAEKSAFLKRELLRSPPVAVARGIKDVIDTGAGFLSRLGGVEEQAQVKAMNQAGRAEFDAAVDGQVLPRAARLAGNITATAPAVTALGGSVAPLLPRLGAAIRSGGMTTGAAPATVAGRVGDMGVRMAGGAAGGALSAGMVDPEDVEVGALIGAAAPPALRILASGGSALGSLLRGVSQPSQLSAAVREARDLGYVIPPTQARPTLANRFVEGMAGKITTAQNASARNQAVTNRLASDALGLPPETQITAEVLDKIRAEAGEAYKAVSALPKRPAQAADTLSNRQAVEAIDPKAMVFDLRKARNDSTAWFRSYGRTADPDALAKAQAAGAEAKRLEATLEEYASSLGKPELVEAMRVARQRIAKTYTVEGALTESSGNVSARKLASDLGKGKPLSGPLAQAGRFAQQFPKAAQSVEGMGSLPQTSPLDWAVGGGLSMATSNPLAMLLIGSRPVARAVALSGPVQNRLVQPPPSNALAALMDPEIQSLVLRSAPLLGTDR